MKVRIGPYPGERSKKERVVKIEIEPFDTWSMDNTLAKIILPMLIQLNATKHGAPHTDDEDVPVELRSISAKPKENDWDTDEFHHARWDWILNEMIWAFTQLNLDDNGETQFQSGTMLWQALDANENPIGKPHAFAESDDNPEAVFYTLVEGLNNTFKVNEEGLKAHWDRIRNGTLLFGKYYSNLWD